MTGHPPEFYCFTTVYKLCVIPDIFYTISSSSLNPKRPSRLDMEYEKIINFMSLCFDE